MRAIKSLLTLTWKEIKSLFGEPVLMAFMVFVFTVVIWMLAKSITVDVKNAPIGVINNDHSTLSYRIIESMQEPYFQKPVEITRDEADKMMDSSKIIFVLDIPVNFEKDLLAGRNPELQLQIDATMMTQAGAGSTMLVGYINQTIQEFLQLPSGKEPIKSVVNVLYNPNAASEYFVPPMKIGDMLSLMVLILTGAAIIRERERGTLEHLLVMPVNAVEILLSKILANGIVIWCVAMLSMKFVVIGFLGVPIAGSLALYGAGMFLFLFSVAAIAVVLAVIAPTMAQFSLLMLPTYLVLLLFSGSAAPRINMPELAQAISEYWPTTIFAKLSQDILFRGADFAIVWHQFFALVAVSTISLVIALINFQKMLEKQG
ncbi:ABC-2 type transport system permease protein [Cricetibacter osteomyelitidis]|uniref:ABC-2 type transport system permease protein n=1 Tax=Cricetibacter osteomyelitidis TaxID=1521931 RepID=A0A4R2T8S5_9PAST|nr:ABC transporter permease [Cricetibacter osteomyelitidis]TCP97274.1 ABC-2 type transport system permease protein [Cricetibacter osteomyelitidis]